MADGSSFDKETLRPSFKDLATYDAETLEWPASASVAREAPPKLVSGKGKSKAPSGPAAVDNDSNTRRGTPKSVRIAPASENEVRYYEPPPRQREPAQFHRHNVPGPSSLSYQEDDHDISGGVADESDFSGTFPAGRFQLPLDDDDEDPEGHPGLRGAPSLPIIGGVQERPSRGKRSEAQSDGAGLPKPSSRFKAMRQAEKEGGQSETGGTARRPRAPPDLKPTASVLGRSSLAMPSAVTHTPAPSRDPGVLQVGGEEGDWLDEDGNAMSAFRKARLVKQGLGPPGGYSAVRHMSAPVATASEEANSESEGQGDLASLLKTISKENEDRLRGMKQEDVAQDLKDLETMFGKDMLEELRKRKQGGKSQAPRSPPEERAEASSTVSQANSPPAPPVPDVHEADELKPVTPPSNLDYIIIDATGALLPVPADPTSQVLGPENAYLPDESDPSGSVNEGYSLPSVLLFARSAIAAQRTMALNMLHRVCSRFPASIAYMNASEERIQLRPGTTPDAAVAATHLYKASYHLDVALTSIFLLSDRQRSVRSAALSCLRTALLFGSFEAHTARSNDWGVAIKRLMDARLFTGLGNILRGDESEQKSSRELIIRILLQLVQLDARVADALMVADRGRFLEILVQTSLRVAWPCKEVGSASSMRPVPACVSLLLELVRSSRGNANELIKRDLLEPLLRFVAVQPWTLDDDEAPMGFELLELTLEAYRALARYGFFASLVSRAWDVFAPIQAWAIARIQPGLTKSEASVLTAFYELLAAWTVCAIDPHQTTPEHEVTWSQAESWIDFTMDTLESLIANSSSISFIPLDPLAAVFGHVEAWLDGAQENAPSKRAEVLARLRAILGGASQLQETILAGLISPGSEEAVEEDVKADEDDESSESVDQSEKFAAAFSAAASIVRLGDNATLADDLLSRGQEMLSSGLVHTYLEEANVTQRQKFLAFLSVAAESSHESLPRPSVLRLLSMLQPGEESFAAAFMRSLGRCFSASDNDKKSFFNALIPFFLECAGIRPNNVSEAKRPLASAPPKSTPADLKRTRSLRPPARQDTAQQVGGGEAPEDEETEVENDPVTGTVLWRCPASDLPLRPDWPLLALDDLLRSAEAAVFNRQDNLPADWDPNERQVVQASLSFAVWCFAGEQDTQDLDEGSARRLQSAHLYLAAQKVFMLESGIQGDMKKWTGAITGKDLFRDAAIVPELKRLLALADGLARSEARATAGAEKAGSGGVNRTKVTLEDLAIAHFGPETTYYSFYTDLVGLYDSISFGDALFALILLPPTATALYPADYRRLLWRDYAHLLPTLRTRVEDAPGGVGSYLAIAGGVPAERRREGDEQPEADKVRQDKQTIDEDLLQSYVSALLPSPAVPEPLTAETHPLLFRIALSHVAAYLWGGERSARAGAGATGEEPAPAPAPLGSALARAFFGPAAQGSATLADHLLRYDVKGEQEAGVDAGAEVPLLDEKDEVVLRRKEWIRVALGTGAVKA